MPKWVQKQHGGNMTEDIKAKLTRKVGPGNGLPLWSWIAIAVVVLIVAVILIYSYWPTSATSTSTDVSVTDESGEQEVDTEGFGVAERGFQLQTALDTNILGDTSGFEGMETDPKYQIQSLLME